MIPYIKLGCKKLSLSPDPDQRYIALADSLIEIHAGRDDYWKLDGFTINYHHPTELDAIGNPKRMSAVVDEAKMGVSEDEAEAVIHWMRVERNGDSPNPQVYTGSIPVQDVIEVLIYEKRYVDPHPTF